MGRLAEGLLEMTDHPLNYRTPTGDAWTIDLRPVLDEALGTKADPATPGAALVSEGDKAEGLTLGAGSPLGRGNSISSP